MGAQENGYSERSVYNDGQTCSAGYQKWRPSYIRDPTKTWNPRDLVNEKQTNLIENPLANKEEKKLA